MTLATASSNSSQSLSTGKSGGVPPVTYAKNGWKADRKVTAMMVEDMIHDPILAAKVLLGAKIPPHEELRILVMWTKHFTLDDSGFSTGKSYTYAIVSALRSLLFPNRISGILSGTFRQGQLIFQNFDRWYVNSKIFRNCVKIVNGKPRLVHGQIGWQAWFRGGSEIRVLPPNFLQDSERLRSERWNDGYFDEWTTFGNFRAFTATIIGRVTAANNYPDCPIRQNHIHLSSTPNFTHHPSHRIVKRIQANIEAGNRDYARMTFNYRHVPKTKKWGWMINRKVIYSMQTMNPKGVVDSEVNGLWTADSLSYYSSSTVEDASLRKCPHVLLRRFHKDDVYLAAFDSARGRQEGNRRNKGGDDFAISVLRIPFGTGIPQYVFASRYNDIEAEEAAAIVHECHLKFGLSYILYDPNGGGMFVRDQLRKPEITIKGKLCSVYPLIEMNDTTGMVGESILVPFRRSSYHIDQIWGKMQSDSVLVNRMHQNMRELLRLQAIHFPPIWNGWQELGCLGQRREVDSMRDILNQATGLNDRERAHAEIDLAIRQLVSVDVDRNEAGDPLLDKFKMYSFKSKEKKDLAYSLIYATVLKLIWDRLGESGGGSRGGSSFYVETADAMYDSYDIP